MAHAGYRAAYEAAEAARIKLAAELASLRKEIRQERAKRDHPVLATGNIIDLVRGADDEEYATNARTLAEAIEAARTGV